MEFAIAPSGGEDVPLAVSSAAGAFEPVSLPLWAVVFSEEVSFFSVDVSGLVFGGLLPRLAVKKELLTALEGLEMTAAMDVG